MKGFILQNAYFDAVEYESQARRIKEELNLLGVECDVIRNRYGDITVDKNIITAFSGYDFCVYLDKDKYLLKALEKLGMRTFNGFDAIEVCDDKMATHLALSGNGVDMPTTIPAVLCYDAAVKVGENEAEIIEKTLGYPLVIKSSYGSRGAGVYLIKDRARLIEKMNEMKSVPHLFQKFIPESYGKDLRVIVIGGKVLGGMLRQSEGDFRSNVALGGSAKPYPVDEKTQTICEKCARLLGLDYCGIDVLFGKDDTPYICEVNSNAFFYGFESATGINVAKAYAEYIINTIQKSR
ncbi:MAG: RimK family alpha-L-glutamate ligase [Candidatus Coproplasma sp.]